MFERSAFLLITFFASAMIAQERLPEQYFRSPIDTIIILAGNFGELRAGHFHAGIDIKTGNKEGMPVHAVADGYVSRVKISSFGYGKVIYITHPNGFVSVYGHLSSFRDPLGTYVRNQQYAQKKFEIELFPKPGEFPLKKGEIIAFSGNTGNTLGPHLHFEIRKENTEKAINPLLFGIPVKDNKKPQIKKLKIYPADESAIINGVNQAREYAVKITKNGYVIDSSGMIRLSGNIYFGLNAFDTENAIGGRNGVFSVELQVNKHRVYLHEMDSIGFDETIAINSFIDYPYYLKTGEFFQRSYVEPNNKLGVYRNVVNNGIVNFKNDSIYVIHYILKDFSGNTSELSFIVQSYKSKIHTAWAQEKSPIFHCQEENKFSTNNFKLNIPANSLYSDISFQYHASSSISKSDFSEIHHVHVPNVPLYHFLQISIKPYPTNDSIKKHLFIARIKRNGKREYAGGEWENDFITTKAQGFGDYVVTADTIAPVIKRMNSTHNKHIAQLKSLEFKITDDFSGIESFNATIDGKWILMEYDYKNNKLTYTIDTSSLHSPFDPGIKRHLFKLVVSDKAGNNRIFTSILTDF
jgi:hypothetical protein